MVLLALIAAATSAQAQIPSGGTVVRQATASVRIVSGARISSGEAPERAIVRDAEVRVADGSRRTVRLIEFP